MNSEQNALLQDDIHSNSGGGYPGVCVDESDVAVAESIFDERAPVPASPMLLTRARSRLVMLRRGPAQSGDTSLSLLDRSLSDGAEYSTWGHSPPKISTAWSLVKRSGDFFGSLVLLVALAPLFLLIFFLVAVSGGNAIFGHRRLGRAGRWFTCYKFRTMVPNAQQVLEKVLLENQALREEWARDEKLRKDPRVTWAGEFLRKTSLDELPQLYNVLIGDMSLVGPRPATEEGIVHYGKALRWYSAVRPGMTGLWQVSGRNKVSFRRRVALDTCYVRNQSFLLDIQILLRTVKVVIYGDGC